MYKSACTVVFFLGNVLDKQLCTSEASMLLG